MSTLPLDPTPWASCPWCPIARTDEPICRYDQFIPRSGYSENIEDYR